MELLTRLMADPEVSAMLNSQQLVLQHSLPLGCYLLKPVQRILKYQLLLQVFVVITNTAFSARLKTWLHVKYKKS